MTLQSAMISLIVIFERGFVPIFFFEGRCQRLFCVQGGDFVFHVISSSNLIYNCPVNYARDKWQRSNIV